MFKNRRIQISLDPKKPKDINPFRQEGLEGEMAYGLQKQWICNAAMVHSDI